MGQEKGERRKNKNTRLTTAFIVRKGLLLVGLWGSCPLAALGTLSSVSCALGE